VAEADFRRNQNHQASQDRRIIGVGDGPPPQSRYFNDVRPWVTMMTRLRLNAAPH
jgi:hypothetical protein